jgi:hypothetical protein
MGNPSRKEPCRVRQRRRFVRRRRCAGAKVPTIVRRTILPALAGIFLISAAASAQQAIPTDSDIDRRLRFIEQRLDDSQTHGQVWYWGWMGLDSASALGFGVAAATADENDDRINYAASAMLGAIGVADLLFRPLEAREGAEPLRELPEATRQQRLAKLHAGEDRLRRNAGRADERWSPLLHGANLAVATTAGVVVGVWGKESDGVITGASALVGGIAYLLTEPSAPAQDWEDYKALTGGRADTTGVDVQVAALPGGAMLRLRYRW